MPESTQQSEKMPSPRAREEQVEMSRTLWVGENRSPEFGFAWEALSSATLCERVETIAAALDSQTLDRPPELIVLACPRPLADTSLAIRLAEYFEVSECLQLLGVWCEGEGRTGKIAEGWNRLFWHAWPTWWSQRTNAAASSNRLNNLHVVVQSHDAENPAAISEALARYGSTTVWERTNDRRQSRSATDDRPGLGVWVGKQLGGREADSLAEFCSRMGGYGAPVLALLDFPRPETGQAARQLGATAVLGKPFGLDELLREMGDSLRLDFGQRRRESCSAGSRNESSNRAAA